MGPNSTLAAQKESKRTEYPGYYELTGEFSQAENDRKTSRFNSKNKLLLDEAILNLNEIIELMGVKP
jgi:hypothetical protein